MNTAMATIILISLPGFMSAAYVRADTSDRDAGLHPGIYEGSIHPDAPDELRQFDFMVGSFERQERQRNPDGSWGDWQAGEWNARYFLNGFGIIDESVNYVTGVSTANTRIFDSAEHRWKVTWFRYPDYKSLTAEGTRIGDRLVLTPTGSEHRYVFSDIEPDGYRWTLEIPIDGEYVPVREILSHRKTLAAAPETQQ